MEVFEAVKTALAVRSYQDKPIPPFSYPVQSIGKVRKNANRLRRWCSKPSQGAADNS